MSPNEPQLDQTIGADGPARDSRGARLIVVQGQGQPPVLDLEHAAIGIGRHEDNDMVLVSNQVSRFHVRVERDGARFVAVDSGSHNGTWVNGVRLEVGRPVSLGDQDLIQIADFRVMFVAGDTCKDRLRTIALDREKVSAEAEDALRRFLDGD